MPGWADLVICGVTDGPDVNKAYIHECNFADIFTLVRAVITDLVVISTFLTVIALVYAGIILLTSGGNTSALSRAKGIFWNVLIGYVWILAAWLVVYTITSVLLNPGYSLLGAP